MIADRMVFELFCLIKILRENQLISFVIIITTEGIRGIYLGQIRNNRAGEGIVHAMSGAWIAREQQQEKHGRTL